MAEGYSNFAYQNGLQELSIAVAPSNETDNLKLVSITLSNFPKDFYVHIALIIISTCIILLQLALSIRRRSYMARNRYRRSTNNQSFRVIILDLCAHGSRLGSTVVAFVEISHRVQGQRHWAEAFLLTYIFLIGILRASISDIEWRTHLLQHLNLLSVGALLLALVANLAPFILLGSSYNLSTLTLCKLGFVASAIGIIWATPRAWHPKATSHKLYCRIPGDEPSPEEICSYFSYFISYSWLTGLVFRGCQRQLNLHDLPPLPWFDEPLICLDRIISTRIKTSNTLWTILNLMRNENGGMIIFGVIQALFELVAPFAGFKLLQSFEHPTEIIFRPLIWVIILFLGLIIKSIASHQYNFRSTRLMVRLRLSLTQELYQKMLNSRQTHFSVTGSQVTVQAGSLKTIRNARIANPENPVYERNQLQALNLVQKDVEYLTQSRDLVLAIVGSPIILAFCTRFLRSLVGWRSFAGLMIVLFSFPIIALLTRRMSATQIAAMYASDDRIALVSECLQSIQIIKRLGFEEAMLAKIMCAQALEQRQRWRQALYSFAINAAGNFIPLLGFSSILLIFTFIEGKQLSASIAFTSFAVIEVIRHHSKLISSVARCIGQAWASCQRIDLYLESEEVERHDYGPPILRNATFKISPTSSFCLQNLNAAFSVGKLNIVLGDSGSGKSSLLLSLLGETRIEKGRVTFPESVAYVPQNPTLMNGTIRDNILFHSTLISMRYNAVIEACGLHKDLEALEFGHLQQVGEGGNALSNGQRQRIALARAVYSTRSCLLLDDVFSFLDEAAVIHIWNRCFRAGFINNRTVILTTQQPWLAREADLVLVMDDGKFVEKHIRPTDPEATQISVPMIPKVPRRLVEANMLFAGVSQPRLDLSINSPISHETRIRNRNSMKLIFEYIFLFGGKTRAVLIFIILFLAQAALFAALVWLSIWVSYSSQKGIVWNTVYLPIYGAILLSFILLASLGDAFFHHSAWKSAGMIHDRLSKSVLAASFKWLQETPHRWILQRFSKDILNINMLLPNSLHSSVLSIFHLLLRVVGLTSIMPIFALPAALICVCGFIVGEMYTRAQLSVKNIASASRLHVLSHFKETISLLNVIRAHRLQEDFADVLADRLRDQARAEETQHNLDRWVGIRIDALAALVSLSAGIIAIKEFDSLPPGLVGLALISVISLSRTIPSLVMKASETEVQLNSFQRVQEYTEIESEELLDNSSLEIPTHVPEDLLFHNQFIAFRNISAKYNLDGPDILKNISFKIKAGERIGIVGRTGSGRSTLLLTLLRALHITSGSVSIGDVDIRHFPLSQLRQDMIYIPQDSFLFSGSIRENIDPTSTIPEEILAQSYELCKDISPLSGQSSKDPDVIKQDSTIKLDLDTQVGRGGQNLSTGQRQIIGIMRAIARKSLFKIALIDEPTANLDRRADAKVQQILHTRLEGYTVLTVAHHLSTVMDCDRIIVLADGEIREMDTPAQLYKDKGLLYDMVEQSRATGVFGGDVNDDPNAPSLRRNRAEILRGESSRARTIGLEIEGPVNPPIIPGRERRFSFTGDYK